MKLIFRFLLITLFVFFPIAHAAIEKNLMPGYETIQIDNIKKNISYLASDELQGRLSLTPGDAAATQWIAAQFKQAGLKPANGDSYLQAVPLIQFIPDYKKSYVQLDSGGKKIKWTKPEVFTEFHKEISLTGEVIFAGYGITAPALYYDDYTGLDVRGKIVLVFEHEPQESNPHSIFNGKANTIYATNRVKALNAQKHGAIAILIAPEPNRKHPSNQERYMRIGGSVKSPPPLQVREDDELQIPVAVISDNAAKIIAGKSSLDNLQTQIDQELKPHSQVLAGTSITIHDENISISKGTAYNVAGLLPGSDNKLKNDTILISAHHDHDGMNKNEIFHGADDNASGTAGVIELARAIHNNSTSSHGLRPKRSLLFVVFAAEERGLLGAFYMTQHPLRPLSSTRAMINFDMIGRNETPSTQTKGLIPIPKDTTNRLNLIGGRYSPDYVNIVNTQNKFIGLDIDKRFDDESALNVFFRSDQFPFVLQNIPAFWWFTGFHPDYHQSSDTADKINYKKMQKILRLAYLSIYAFANTDTEPKFIENPGKR